MRRPVSSAKTGTQKHLKKQYQREARGFSFFISSAIIDLMNFLNNFSKTSTLSMNFSPAPRAFLHIMLATALLANLGCANKNLAADPGFKTKEIVTQKAEQSLKDSNCVENRMALDIGSGSTKVLVAEINSCLQTLRKMHFKSAHPLKIKEQLAQNDNVIPEVALNELIKVIGDWKTKNESLKIDTYRAVATEVFRKAENGEAILKKLSDEINIPIKLIEQSQEAKLGFYSALALSPYAADEIVSWDIGGGSMQITNYASRNNFNFYQGLLASVSFKDLVIELKNRNKPKTQAKAAAQTSPKTQDKQANPTSPKSQDKPTTQVSPNPLGQSLANLAIHEAKKYADSSITPEIKAAAKSKRVLGIGGVHYHSVFRQKLQSLKPKAKTSAAQSAPKVPSGKDYDDNLEKTLPGKKEDVELEEYYTQSDLIHLINDLAHMNDRELPGNYPETDVTNIALVLGFMKAMGLDKVYVVPADLTYGLIVSPE